MVDIGGTQVPEPTMMDHVKNLDLEGAVRTVQEYPYDWMEIGTCIGIGLISGFLFKKYFRTFVMTILFGVLIVVVLDALKLIQVDWNHVQSMIGVRPTQEDFTNLFQAGYAWVKVNVQATMSFGVGFIIGYKVG